MFGYIITVIIAGIASIAVTAICVYHTVRIISGQIKLYHSINLVELRTGKIVYWIFEGIVGLMAVYVILQIAGVEIAGLPGAASFAAQFGIGRDLTVLAFIFPFIAMLAAEVLLVVLGIAKNAVVDKGVYTNFSMVDWHHVHDYIIDEENGILVLSSDKATFGTLRNLTPPFRVARSDIEKLKFILNKNKNKFSAPDVE